MSCGVGCRRGLGPGLLGLWHRLVAAGLIRPLAWEPPHASGAAQKRQKDGKKIIYLFRATPAAYGGAQARGRIRAVATGLRQSYSNTGSELHLQPTPQLMARPDP